LDYRASQRDKRQKCQEITILEAKRGGQGEGRGKRALSPQYVATNKTKTNQKEGVCVVDLTE
jgi:hypothetical protein